MNKNVLDDLVAASPDRRGFLRKLALSGSALGALQYFASDALAQSPVPAITDVDILNFALNLEYLEAEFYTISTTGKLIASSGVAITGGGTSGATTGGSMVAFTDTRVNDIAKELAANEQTHVTLLRGVIAGLGAQPIAKPAINLDALGTGFANQSDFLALARSFEDIGVTAYAGAAPLIANSTILGYAARILAVEALHSGTIRDEIARASIATPTLDGVDHPPPPSGKQYFPTEANALSEVRTPSQVLFIAYGGKANATSGGFFPNGVNGRLNTSAATAAAANSTAILSATPNPILLGPNDTAGSTTITFNAPVSATQLRLGSPDGLLLLNGGGSGSFSTGFYVTDGTLFYLQDATSGNPSSSTNTLATVTVRVQKR